MIFHRKKKLLEYNSKETATKLDLVLFEEAVLNIQKIMRSLNTDKGNVLLIGVAGSGKKSLAKLSAFASNFNIKVIS